MVPFALNTALSWILRGRKIRRENGEKNSRRDRRRPSRCVLRVEVTSTRRRRRRRRRSRLRPWWGYRT